MLLRSTAGQTSAVGFLEASAASLAPDGGLYQPVTWPVLDRVERRSLVGKPFAALAADLAARLIGDEIPAHELRDLCSAAFDFPLPVRALERAFVLELFGGPTLAFKDVGARFLARLLDHRHRPDVSALTVLVATSGDTGSAVAHAFAELGGVRVFVHSPRGGVSDTQRRQFTTLLGNVHAVEVAGSFDDCQALAKAAFADPVLRQSVHLASANSINIGRLLPQSFYYFWAWAELVRLGALDPDRGRLTIAVPSGNFGNLTAGFYAQRMGLPVAGFVAATNRNDVVPQYLRTGRYQPRPSVATVSNAMDVGNPSNFARLLDLAGGDAARLRRHLVGATASDQETLEEIRAVFARTGYLLDPHTAVGYRGLCSALAAAHQSPRGDETVGLVLATAHPAKFEDTVARALGRAIELPSALAALAGKPERIIPIPPDLPSLHGLLAG